MKVVHVSAYLSGGAGLAANRLHLALREHGVDSHHLVLNCTPNIKKSIYSFDRFFTAQRTLKFRIAERFNKKKWSRITYWPKVQGYKSNFEIFTFPSTKYNVEDHPLIKQADVVHLHWVSNFLNYDKFFNVVKKPIVWTLHDLNPIMGGFHYEGDLYRNAAELGELDRSLREYKISKINKSQNLTFVALSRWISQKINEADHLTKRETINSPNGVDLDEFSPVNSSAAKEILRLPQAAKVFLFVSSSISNYRKGGDFLEKLVKSDNVPENVLFISVGKGDWVINSPRLRNLGEVSDTLLMKAIYSAADAVIIPSREDNYPNVMIEAQACGTPVIAFDVGGIPDFIKTNENGILVEKMSLENLENAIAKMAKEEITFSREAIRAMAQKKCDIENQVFQSINLYKDLIDNNCKEKRGFAEERLKNLDK